MRPSVRTLSAAIISLALILIPTSERLGLPKESEIIPPLPVIEQVTDWTPEELNKPPNIIIVLSESFWDMTKLPGLEFSRDPIPMYHELARRYTSGTMLSPMFGGGTANVELEVLTGYSYRFFPEGSIVYEQYIKQPTESLASQLGRQGYATTAISPFHQWFFNSAEVYRHMGFSRFIPLEYFNPDEYVGPYIGDHAVAKRIIEESERSPGADLIFANTMENHYHYWPGKFKNNTITIKSRGNPSAEAIGIAETYAQGSQGADRMLQELILHFSLLKEPTILVFFGDHLPSLEKYTVYTETGYITGEDDPDFLRKMHEVPVLIWNNYLQDAPREQLELSPSFLGPYVLRMAGLQGGAYSDYLSGLYERMPILPPEGDYERFGIDRTLAESWRARQEERFLNEQNHAAEALAAQPPFTLGYGKPEIRHISPEFLTAGGDGNGPVLLTLEGGRFSQGATVYAGGKKLTTNWSSESSVSVNLPKEYYAKPGTIRLEIKVLDSKENVLAISEPAQVTVMPRASSALSPEGK
ncbi:IPT/TIG domain-containing protein [Paenibacillus sp. UNCCL117]|uniref:LTA synthase family protein n=1 Tax=unclassified Paenibacillus TaxID=185978 RepID=UPI00087E78C7|nr:MULTISPECIES: LTA synthase family protein [unclassified Paenibacillus]SDD41402.1 IPT/TIG domain-containing protein [Paenibacillus sp. cl123]SFW47845.1 IPT/TIG domain-containing protein [Paenibacillus sp. UNCCL117]